MKLLVAELIEKRGWTPKSITWTSLETFRTLQQLEEHFIEIQEKLRPKLLCVDEATSVVGWQRVIKKLRDNGTLTNCTLILTGSSAFDLKKGAERMAGRRGDIENPDRVLLPMPFIEFERQVKRKLKLDENQLSELYLNLGGFPFRVDLYLKDPARDIAMLGARTFDDVIFYEFGRRRLDRTIALEVLGRLTTIGAHAISLESFIKPLTIAKETARKYLDALGDAFLLATLSSYDTSRNRVAPKKDKKYLWIDPAFGDLGPWIRQGESASAPTRAEWAVGAHLLRKHEYRIWEGLSAPRNVFTWKSSAGNEVDFLVLDRTARLQLPVEVKYQNQVSDWDFQVMEKAFGAGVIVSRATSKVRPKTRALPLGSFLRELVTQSPTLS